MSIPGSGSPLLLATTAAAAAAEYVIPKSLRFNSGDTSYLDKTFSTAGNRKTFTFSCWLKRAKLGVRQFIFEAGSTDNATDRFMIRFQADDTLMVTVGQATNRQTTQVFRDVGAWAHLIVAVDTTASTANDRIKIYWNGSQITDFSSTSNPSQNADTGVSSAAAHSIGKTHIDNSHYFDGELADVQLVDGQQLAPTDFGETRSSDGVWVPKEYTGSYGPAVDQTQTWSSALSDSTGFASGNGATKAFDGIATADNTARASAQNTTTTFQPATDIAYTSKVEVWTYFSGSVSLNGGSAVTVSNDQDWRTIATGSGTLDTLTFTGSSSYVYLGAIRIDGVLLVDPGVTVPHNGFHLNFSDSSTNEALGFDSAPTTPDPDPKKGMDVITYTGNGGTQNIGGLNFEPGLIWLKRRNASAAHALFDSIRGVTKVLESSNTGAEKTNDPALASFNPDGFSLNTSSGQINASSATYVAWTWRAGGPAVSNSDGTITSQVSANTDYGFSIVSYNAGLTSAGTKSIGHGLNTAPALIIAKDRDDGTHAWRIRPFFLNNNAYDYLEFDNGVLAQLSSGDGTMSLPTSTTFDVNWNASVGASGDIIAYCWSEVSGYSKFGTYEGASTVTVTTGFKPRWILLKNVDTAGSWSIFDSERDSDLEINHRIYANESSAEGTDTVIGDFTDTGFTLTNQGNSNWNTTGDTFVYAAFADRPGNNWDVNNIVTNEGLTTSKDNFDILTWTGDGGSSRAITGLQFSPGLLWVKRRNSALDHFIWDSVRGITKELYPNQNYAEGTTTNKLVSFDSNGFTVKNSSAVNANNDTYVAWVWKAGGTAVSNTDGSITSSVSANAAYGFSIVSFTANGTNGATVGHGLSSAPQLVILKQRDRTANWFVNSPVGTGDGYLMLNSTDAADNSNSTVWNSIAPSSTVVTLGNSADVNNSGTSTVMYCFANVPGYQRVGQYTGNGSTTGPVVVTGFKPRFLLIKNVSLTGSNWFIFDSERSPSNPVKLNLKPNSSATEETDSSGTVDFNQNGFQIKSAGTHPNGNGNTIIYLAIGDDEIGSDEDCLVDVPNAVTADADATDTTGGYQRGNYATLNPLDAATASSLSNGNLDQNGGNNVRATIGAIGSGKWYWEFTKTSNRDTSGTNIGSVGLLPGDTSITALSTYALLRDDGLLQENGASIATYSTWTNGDVIGIAMNNDDEEYSMYKNGTLLFTRSYPSNITAENAFPAIRNNTGHTGSTNFGQMRFKYPMPSGYAALNTTALPAATIEDGSAQFDAVTYTGNGGGNGATQSIAGLEMSPDFVWLKSRGNTRSHHLFDTVRGAGKIIKSNATEAESTSTAELTAFTSDGWTLGDGYQTNFNNEAYVGWAWDAGSSTVSNTDGSITSSVRANPSAGFSIVTYSGNSTSGATIGHGLNAAPEFVVVKARNIGTQGWCVYHASLGATKYIQIDTTNAASTYSGTWNNTSPTNSVFTVGNDNIVNTGYNYVAYCFAPVAGYSAFGSYEGNGSSDGPFVYTGFKPAFLMWKLSSASGGHWNIEDNGRSPVNPVTVTLRANTNEADLTTSQGQIVDLLSNGFKVRNTSGQHNTSGATYIYMAFAENPFQANGGLAR